MRIKEIREKTVSIASSIANAYIDFLDGRMKSDELAVEK
jgi:hypothetical protein